MKFHRLVLACLVATSAACSVAEEKGGSEQEAVGHGSTATTTSGGGYWNGLTCGHRRRSARIRVTSSEPLAVNSPFLELGSFKTVPTLRMTSPTFK